MKQESNLKQLEINKKTLNDDDKRVEYNDVQHINEVLKEILAFNKKEGMDKFEEISMYIKRKMMKLSFQYKQPEKPIKRLIDLTNYEENIIVIYFLLINLFRKL